MATASIRNFQSMPPVTADALVAYANELLISRGSALITKRTLRFYTSNDVVPSPLGSPKFARYDYKHLICLVGARALQDQGNKLPKIKKELTTTLGGNYAKMEEYIDAWLAHHAAPKSPIRARESRSDYGKDSDSVFSQFESMGANVVRILLSPSITLEVTNSVTLESELARAKKEFAKAFDKLK